MATELQPSQAQIRAQEFLQKEGDPQQLKKLTDAALLVSALSAAQMESITNGTEADKLLDPNHLQKEFPEVDQDSLKVVGQATTIEDTVTLGTQMQYHDQVFAHSEGKREGSQRVVKAIELNQGGYMPDATLDALVDHYSGKKQKVEAAQVQTVTTKSVFEAQQVEPVVDIVTKPKKEKKPPLVGVFKDEVFQSGEEVEYGFNARILNVLNAADHPLTTVELVEKVYEGNHPPDDAKARVQQGIFRLGKEGIFPIDNLTKIAGKITGKRPKAQYVLKKPELPTSANIDTVKPVTNEPPEKTGEIKHTDKITEEVKPTSVEVKPPPRTGSFSPAEVGALVAHISLPDVDANMLKNRTATGEIDEKDLRRKVEELKRRDMAEVLQSARTDAERVLIGHLLTTDIDVLFPSAAPERQPMVIDISTKGDKRSVKI